MLGAGSCVYCPKPDNQVGARKWPTSAGRWAVEGGPCATLTQGPAVTSKVSARCVPEWCNEGTCAFTACTSREHHPTVLSATTGAASRRHYVPQRRVFARFVASTISNTNQHYVHRADRTPRSIRRLALHVSLVRPHGELYLSPLTLGGAEAAAGRRGAQKWRTTRSTTSLGTT